MEARKANIQQTKNIQRGSERKSEAGTHRRYHNKGRMYIYLYNGTVGRVM